MCLCLTEATRLLDNSSSMDNCSAWVPGIQFLEVLILKATADCPMCHSWVARSQGWGVGWQAFRQCTAVYSLQ